MQISKEQLKELIDKCCQAIQQGGVILGLDAEFDTAAKMELAMFLMYLSASDGEIKWSEASTISYLCDLDLTPQTLAAFIQEKNIYSTEFENKAPVTLQMAITVDNRLYESKAIDVTDEDMDLPKALINAYEIAANYLINADGDAAANELADLQIYLNTMNEYYTENTVRNKASVSGITKNTSSSVAAPAKSGVSAPQKR